MILCGVCRHAVKTIRNKYYPLEKQYQCHFTCMISPCFLQMFIQEWVSDRTVNIDWLQYIFKKQMRLRKEASRYWTIQIHVLLQWNTKFNASYYPHYSFTLWYYPAICMKSIIYKIIDLKFSPAIFLSGYMLWYRTGTFSFLIKVSC
jgi:hypothetical protein